MFELFEPFECLNKDFKKRGKGGSTVKLRPPLQRASFDFGMTKIVWPESIPVQDTSIQWRIKRGGRG